MANNNNLQFLDNCSLKYSTNCDGVEERKFIHPPFELVSNYEEQYFHIGGKDSKSYTIEFDCLPSIDGVEYANANDFEIAIQAKIDLCNVLINSDQVLNESDVEGVTVTNALNNAKEIDWFNTTGDFPATGKPERLYVSLATSLMYRWNGSTYVLVGDGSGVGGTDLSLGLRKADVLDIDSSTGSSVEVPFVTTTLAGLMQAVDKQKLDGISAGAEVNVNSDWNAASGDAEILNKPSDLTDLSLHTADELSGVSGLNATALGNLSGTNTGDQNLVFTEQYSPIAGTGVGAWVTRGSAFPDSTLLIYVERFGGGGGAQTTGVREVGSTLNRFVNIGAQRGYTTLVNTDASGDFQIYSTSGIVDFFIGGVLNLS